MTVTGGAISQRRADSLEVRVYPDRAALGRAAGADIARAMRELLAVRERIRMVFAAAPSQNETLEALVREELPWERVTAFHMDEYIGLAPDAPQRFGQFLRERLFDAVRPGTVHYIDGTSDPETECERYAGLLREAPIDLVCLGIGENGHLAFNDPPVADFADSLTVKPVELDESCRRQQVNDGCFARIEDVPRRALTMTVPALFAGGQLFCAVPGRTKRQAVQRTLTGEIAADCPATVLRRHPRCTLYVDRDAAEEWAGE
ncbi:glucosamine-6-phosphate deaminase [Cohnella nanjingensis]|uniref:Glucosamine-6-phosphate deaminase n=1 Tax=Cohnella nanjingensis TaxID=1387779 RepID=A0A7X0RPA7_9BACL|nr:glucosamine-6-phosphate deaminase [Cohnella nanjingensis]MBB6671217.1 glucosamine-6-phosphate deaminase [Cohnella nanjingensis]